MANDHLTCNSWIQAATLKSPNSASPVLQASQKWVWPFSVWLPSAPCTASQYKFSSGLCEESDIKLLGASGTTLQFSVWKAPPRAPPSSHITNEKNVHRLEMGIFLANFSFSFPLCHFLAKFESHLEMSDCVPLHFSKHTFFVFLISRINILFHVRKLISNCG